MGRGERLMEISYMEAPQHFPRLFQVCSLPQGEMEKASPWAWQEMGKPFLTLPQGPHPLTSKGLTYRSTVMLQKQRRNPGILGQKEKNVYI